MGQEKRVHPKGSYAPAHSGASPLPFCAVLCRYDSPVGEILLRADTLGLSGLWIEGQRGFAAQLPGIREQRAHPAICQTIAWLDLYFAGRRPDFLPPLHLQGTAFQMEVWELLKTIPYGETTTYGAVAKALAQSRGMPRMSAQAVGGAVGRNPIAIVIPCHRVIGTNGSLTGYAGGLDRKLALLKLEQAVIPEKEWKD